MNTAIQDWHALAEVARKTDKEVTVSAERIIELDYAIRGIEIVVRSAQSLVDNYGGSKWNESFIHDLDKSLAAMQAINRIDAPAPAPCDVTAALSDAMQIILTELVNQTNLIEAGMIDALTAYDRRLSVREKIKQATYILSRAT